MAPWLSRLQTFLGGSKSLAAGERRQAPRYKMEIRVTVITGDRSLQARTCDLSQTGMGVYLTAELDIGEPVVLQYELGDGSSAKKVRGIVRNRVGNRYGIEFAG